MTPTQSRVLRQLADRGMQTDATIATGASLSVYGTVRALQALERDGCVEREHGGYWHLTVAGVDLLRAAGARA